MEKKKDTSSKLPPPGRAPSKTLNDESPPVSLRSYGFPGGGSRVYSMVKVDGEELVLAIPVSVEASRDLKISIVTKGKEKKTRWESNEKKREKKTYTGKAQYIRIVPLQLAGKQTRQFCHMV